jgi:stage V sporulation protein B
MERKRAPGVAKQSFLHGALILVVAIAIEKIIGALFKLPLAWILTPVGNGYFGNAYSLYSPLFSLATAGFPIAISRLVSESSVRGRYRDIRQIHKISIRIFFVLGIAAFSIMLFGAKPYVHYAVSNSPQNALPAIYALAPAVFFTSMMSIYRGYYEGLRNMYPTAISEVIEALCKLIFGLTASYFIVRSGMDEYAASGTVYGVKMASEEYAKMATLPYAAAGAICGVTLGGVFAFLFLFFYHKRNGDGITPEMLRASPRPRPVRVETSRLIRTAVPVALGSLAVNLSTFVDSTFLQKRINDIMQTHSDVLISMYSGIIPSYVVKLNSVPNFLFGCFSNASTLFMVVPAVTQAFGVSALPSVTEAWTQGNPRRLRLSIESVLRIVAIITIPAGLGLSVLSTPIASLMFGSENAPTVTGRILVVLGLASIFAAMSTPINSMLQAIGRVDLPVKLLAFGIAIKVVLNYTLVGIPEVNVMGAGTGTLVCYLLITVFSLFFLCRETKVVPNFIVIFLKPLLASVLAVGAAFLVQKAGSMVGVGKAATCAAVLVAAVLYVFCLLWFKALSRHDILMLPRGQKIEKILEKHNWIR